MEAAITLTWDDNDDDGGDDDDPKQWADEGGRGVKVWKCESVKVHPKQWADEGGSRDKMGSGLKLWSS